MSQELTDLPLRCSLFEDFASTNKNIAKFPVVFFI